MFPAISRSEDGFVMLSAVVRVDGNIFDALNVLVISSQR